MSEPRIRIDQLTGLRSVLAPGRAERPDAFVREPVETRTRPEDCPFCEGHEDRTPPEVYAVRPGGGEPNTPANIRGWIKDPQAKKPGTLMPNLGLSDKESDDLAAFLVTLR